MTSKELNVAIVGCGKFAEEQLQEIKKISRANVVAACDREELMAQQLAERYDVPNVYVDVEKMCADLKPDVVHIVTPPQTHLQIGKLACQRGSHIYVEKPFTVNYAEAVQLIDIANECDRKVTVGHVYHFDPAARRMRELVTSGILGDPIHIDVTWGYNLENEYGYAFLANREHWIYNLPGGLFHNVISHLVERVLEFTPDEMPSVQVVTALWNEALRKKQVKVLDELRVLLGWSSVTASLNFSCNLRPLNALMRIYGTRSTIDVDFGNRTAIVRRGRMFPTMIGRLLRGFDLAKQYNRSVLGNVEAFLRSDFQHMAGMNYLINAFYTSIMDNTPPPIPYGDILRTTKIMDLIFERSQKA